jgi:ethanolamine ammonia-lyase small subunit
LDLQTAFAAEFIEKWNLFEVTTRASTKIGISRPPPPLGREFTDESRAEILSRCLPGKNIQIAIGDVYQL